MGGFVVIEKSEFLLKLKRLGRSAASADLWKRGEKKITIFPREIEERGSGNILLTFTFNEEIEFFPGQEFFLHFSQNSIQYFASGNLNKQDNLYKLEISEKVFRREKRKNERLLTFPHKQVFVYLNLGKNNFLANVFYLDEKLGKKKDILENFLKLKGPREGLTGFRVLDISKSGFSFTASKKERQFLLEGKTEAVEINFQGLIYELPEVKVIHIVDYIDPRFGHIQMFKVGVRILKMNELLSKKISQLLGEEGEFVQVSHDFEKIFK